MAVESPLPEPQPTARLLFVGDVMLGRSIAPILDREPEEVFRHIRRVVRSADLAVANIESPLTHRPHSSGNPYQLEADPATAHLLAAAGFDVGSVANNHAGDAGPKSVLDSLEALTAAGMIPVGGGATHDDAWEPVLVNVKGIHVALLAIDVSRQGLEATDETPGIAAWAPDAAEQAIRAADASADIVVVGIHGGVAYRSLPDPLLGPVAEELVDWGADVVWGTGPHVVQPVEVIAGTGGSAIVATSLGNFLFDQFTPETSSGLVLEVMVDRQGVIAHRIGSKVHDDGFVRFTGWGLPASDAVVMAGSWWSLDRPTSPAHRVNDQPVPIDADVVSSSVADLDGDELDEILVSYRHPVREKAGDPMPPPETDRMGRSAHIGVLELDGTPVWLSRRPPHAVVDLAACDGTAAFAYSELDDAAVIATGAGTWSGFGFVMEAELPGEGDVVCIDVDGDGRTEAAVVGRS